MTFKHVKFQDSPIMRSLEKVAYDKGLVKPEVLQKTAAVTKKADYTPTDNLMENVFKLCAGLRTQGLEKEALEIEMNYLQYKQAQTLYETSKEKGEDQIHDAHPDGSHKLENVDADEAVFEDILDQHVKIMDVMNKKPSGKLSNAAQVIGAVKKALGQAQSESDKLETQIRNNVNQVLSILARVGEKAKSEMTVASDYDWSANPVREAAKNPTKDNLDKMKDNLNDLIERIKPGWVAGITQDTWDRMAGPLLTRALQLVAQARGWRERANEISATQELGDYSDKSDGGGAGGSLNVPEVTIKGDPLSGKLQNLIGRLQAALAVRSIASNPQVRKWISEEIAEIKQEQSRIEGIPEEQRDAVNAQLQSDVAAYEKEVNEFYTDWVNVNPKA